MKKQTNFSGLKGAYIVLVTLSGSRMWSFQGLPDVVFDLLEFFTALSLLWIVLSKYYLVDSDKTVFTPNVILFILLPLISMIPAAVFHNQSFLLSLSILRTNFAWLLYFALHIFDVPKRFVIKWMTVVGVVWAALTIVQQFTYPHVFFYTRDESSGSEFIRAGMYRFMLDPQNFGVFIVVFYYHKFLVTRKISALIYVCIGLAGFYFYATRQFAVATLICVVILSLMQPGSARVYSVVAIGIVLFLLLLNSEALFGTYIQMTNDQISGDDIRLYSAKYFLFEYWPHWITVLIGNGYEHLNSDYGKEISYLGLNLGYFKGDVGIISPLNTFGIFYVLNIFWVNIKGLMSRFYTSKTMYLEIFFINALMLLIISEYYSYPAAIPFFCFTFYLVDKSNQKRKKLEAEGKDVVESMKPVFNLSSSK